MRRQFLSGLIFALTSFAVAAPAFAADMPVKTEKRRAEPQRTQQTAKSNWSGGQLGGSNGVSSVNNNFVEPGAYVCPAGFPFGVSCFETPFGFGGHPVSYTIGPFLGYRWQFGNSVVGVEADWSWKRAETSGALAVGTVCFDPGCLNYRTDAFSGTVRQNWDSSLRARYGWLINPDTLVYGTAGLAVGNISGSFNYLGVLRTTDTTTVPVVVRLGSTATAAGYWSDTRVGGTVGAGVEYALWGGWKARVEYRYTDFGSFTKNVAVATTCVGTTGCSAPSNNASINLHESFHTVRVGLGFDF